MTEPWDDYDAYLKTEFASFAYYREEKQREAIASMRQEMERLESALRASLEDAAALEVEASAANQEIKRLRGRWWTLRTRRPR